MDKKVFKVGGKARAKMNLNYCKKGAIIDIIGIDGNSILVDPSKSISRIHGGRIAKDYLEPIESKRNLKDFYERF